MNRKLSALLLAACFLPGITGCGQTTPEKEQVTIYLRNYADHLGVFGEDEPNADYDDMTRYMAEKFISQYDKYDVTIETEYYALEDEPKFIAGKYGAPDATDVVLQGDYDNLGHIYEGKLIPLDDVIPEDIRAENLHYQIDGRLYDVPYCRLPTLFIYNAELFRQAGLEAYIAGKEEIADWSIQEWNEILAGLKAALPQNIYPMMMYGTSTNGDMVNMMLLRMFGNPFFDENGNACLGREDGVQALRWIQENHDKGYYPPGAENIDLMDCFALYCNRQLAIYFGNNVMMPMITDPSIDTRYAMYPHVNGGMSLDFTYTFGILDNGDEKRLEVSRDFLRFVYSDPEMLSLCGYAGELPAVSSAAQGAELPMLEQWLSILDSRVDYTNRSPNYPGIRQAFYPQITAMLSGSQTPEETARNLDEQINAALEEGRLNGSLHD